MAIFKMAGKNKDARDSDRLSHSMWSRKRQIRAFLASSATTLLAVGFASPFFFLFLTSIKADSELAAYPIRLWPSQVQWINFQLAVTMIDYGRYLWNTVFLATIFAVLTTLSCAMVGFAFARLRGWGKRQFFILMLSTIMLPSIITVIPSYIVYARLDLLNTYWPWVLGGLGTSPFLTFLFRQFFSSIPKELEEAAIVDGCSYLRMFFQIFLPLSKPVIATVALLAFVGVWGDYVTPRFFLSGENTTLAVAMTGGYVRGPNIPIVNVLSAGTILYLAPVLLVFLLVQRSFVRGIVTTGLKG
jgi:multiple sugar transport system permease protein